MPQSESVQRRAARFPGDSGLTIAYQRSTNVSFLMDELNWSSLQEREEHSFNFHIFVRSCII